MDNLCHTLAGAALGDAGLKRHTAHGMVTLMIASNLPDVDVLVFFTDTLPMSFRRGWTHGVLALAILPAAFAAVMLVIDRIRPGERRANFRGLMLLAYIGTWLHVFMDFLNSYGVRLLMPFSERWFYGASGWARSRVHGSDARVEHLGACGGARRPRARRTSYGHPIHGDAGVRQSAAPGSGGGHGVALREGTFVV
jgi:hypothetical protein